MRHCIEYWNSFWFPETTVFNLAMCRIIVVGIRLFVLMPHLGNELNLLQGGAGFTEPQLLIVSLLAIIPEDIFLTPTAFLVMYWVTSVAGATTLIGLATRTSAFVFALGNWILVAHIYSYAEEHHVETLLCIFLMLLAFSPSGDRLSIDALIRRRHQHSLNEKPQSMERVSTAAWPLKLIQILFAYTYFSTGLGKIVYGGLTWINGYTLQQYILRSALSEERALGIWLAQQHTLCILLSIGTILFELLFPVVLFFSRIMPYILIAGICFHAGIYMTMGADFFEHILLYVVFIDFESWAPWFEKVKASIIGRPGYQVKS